MNPAVRALKFIRPYRKLFVLGQLVTLFATAAGLVFPLLTRDIIDGLIGSGGHDAVTRSVVLLAAAFSCLALLTYVKERALGDLSLRVVRDLRDRVFSKIPELPFRYFDQNRSGDVISVMTNDINRVQDSVSRGLAFVVTQIVSLVVILVLLLQIDVILTALMVAVVPPFVAVVAVVSRKSRIQSRRLQGLLGNVTSIAAECVRGIDVVKSYVLGSHAIGIFRKTNDDVLETGRTQVRLTAAGAALSTIAGGIAIITLIGVGGARVLRGLITPGELVAYLIYAQMIIGPIGMLTGIVVEIQKALAAIERVFALIDVDGEPRAVTPKLPSVRDIAAPVGVIPRDSIVSTPGASVEFRNVDFSYVDGRPVLVDVSITARPGEFIALVGPSGAGKSSLLKLLVRFYEPTTGTILLDGIDLSTIPIDDVRRETALVMQETHLFDMSVLENILAGDPDRSDEDVIHAAQAAHAAEFVEEMSAGYHSRIGENGTQLSGGQRQRISLARAFLKNPRLLLLDEATSALDTESEKKVQAALARLMTGRTTVAIAHRLSTVQNADRIYVMDRGSVIASGRHDELLARCRMYSDLCEQQMIRAPA